MMRVVVAGGHGKIALLLQTLLAERGDAVAGLIRNPAHAADVRGVDRDAAILLDAPATGGTTFELISRGTTIAEAVSVLTP